MTNNLVQIVKDVKPATREDLERVLVNADTILKVYTDLQKLIRKAPIVIQAFIEEHGGDVSMLDMLRSDLCEYIKCVA